MDKNKVVVRPIDDKNRITIPPELLKDVGLAQGDHVILKEVNGRIQVIKAKISEA